MWRRPTTIGAATTRLEVNIAEAVAPAGATATARSGLPLALMPAVVAPQRKPVGTFGASECEAEEADAVSVETVPGAVVLIMGLLYQALNGGGGAVVWLYSGARVQRL